MARALRRSPELNAGWPQQVWRGTSTVQPASSRSFAAANPIEGRIRSTRQVTNRPTRLPGSAIDAPWRVSFVGDIGRKGLIPQATAAGLPSGFGIFSVLIRSHDDPALGADHRGVRLRAGRGPALFRPTLDALS